MMNNDIDGYNLNKHDYAVGTSFPRIDKKVVRIKRIFKRYLFEDLVKSVFCICSWIDNRSSLESCLALNKALVDTDNFGNKPIQNYQDFSEFFSLLKEQLPVDVMDDFIIDDFGEVKIRYKNKAYPVILGTGYEMTFCALQFISELGKILDMEDLIVDTLEYLLTIINYLQKYNISNHEEPGIYFERPSEDFYNAVQNYFYEIDFLTITDNIVSIFSDDTLPIDRRHFIIRDDKLYPLFNTSLLVDLYHYMLTQATHDEIKKHVDNTIINTVFSIYDLEQSLKPKVLWPVSMIKDNKPVSKFYYTFAALAKDSIIIAINREHFRNSDIEEEITKLHEAHKTGELIIGEMRARGSLGEHIGVNVERNKKINIIVYDCFTDITQENLILGTTEKNYFTCSALDLIFLLNYMDDFEELDKFFKYYYEDNSRIIAFGGKSSIFTAWKSQDHMISKGAINFNLLSIASGTVDGTIVELYKDKLSEYPFNINCSMFNNPFYWNIGKHDCGFYRYESKVKDGFFGYGKLLANDGYIFLTHNLRFYNHIDIKNADSVKLQTIDELNLRLFKRYKKELSKIKSLNSTLLQIMYMPWEYAKLVDNTGFLKKEDCKYVYSDMHMDLNHIIIRYTVDMELLFEDIQNSDNKSVESQYLIELLKPLEEYLEDEYKSLKNQIEKDSLLPKDVDVAAIRIDYYYSDKSKHFYIEDKKFHEVRKRIAQICYEQNIMPGIFQGKEATSVIRDMQKYIISDFEYEVTKYNKLDLHNRILSLYASCLHDININRERYNSFSDINPDVLKEIKEETVRVREKYKRNLRTASYLLETNLFLDRRDGLPMCDNDIFEFLLAYADWLVVLQDNADSCFYDEKLGDKNIKIEITNEYLVNILVDDDVIEKMGKRVKRSYDYEDYIKRDVDEDKKFLGKVIQQFQLDIGISLPNMLAFLQYLQLEFMAEIEYKEVAPNVFSVNKNLIIQDFYDCLIDKIEIAEIKKIIDFLTIDYKKLKLWKGNIQEFLPINEREKRDNRFEVKPLVIIDDNIIFSPIVAKELYNRWTNGLLDFYPPYEIGLNGLLGILDDWKKVYEDKMVYDIANIFKEKGFNKVWCNAELYSLDKDGNHPIELGDYDVIAVDDNNYIIWIIESKVLRKVGSIFEDRMQQHSFFYGDKEDEKFQKRIDYFKKNYKRFLKSQDITTIKNYEIRPYMVTNKLFDSRFKELDFPIVMFYEFESIIDIVYGYI